MTLAGKIEHRLRETLAPLHFQLVDESSRHKGRGTETHFNLIIVSAAFEGKNGVARHRAVYGALGEAFDKGMHALTMKTLTPAEWEAAGRQVENPPPKCG